jgi:hypothetical protein
VVPGYHTQESADGWMFSQPMMSLGCLLEGSRNNHLRMYHVACHINDVRYTCDEFILPCRGTTWSF